jgi:hypothetical protein
MSAEEAEILVVNLLGDSEISAKVDSENNIIHITPVEP